MNWKNTEQQSKRYITKTGGNNTKTHARHQVPATKKHFSVKNDTHTHTPGSAAKKIVDFFSITIGSSRGVSCPCYSSPSPVLK